MSEAEIAHIVQAVLRQLEAQDLALDAAPDTESPLALQDLGSEAVRQTAGVQHPQNAEVAASLQQSTRARVCLGRAGPRPRTLALLRFLADHARSKDTVLSEVAPEWIERAGLFEVKTQVVDKDQYLTRPDLGRVLTPESVQTLLARCKKSPDVQVVVSDGLSTEATTANFEDIVPALLRGLESMQLSVGTPIFVRFGRVKVEDQIGELLKPKVVILLIGERPGLGQSESLSCYMVYRPAHPTGPTMEADRTCISNIHRQGTPPVEAAAVIAELAARMIEEQASGIALVKKMAQA